MFKSLLKGIAVSVVAFTGSASASPTMYALLDNSTLLDTVEQTGTEIWYNPETANILQFDGIYATTVTLVQVNTSKTKWVFVWRIIVVILLN